jgi:hypothetical protein
LVVSVGLLSLTHFLGGAKSFKAELARRQAPKRQLSTGSPVIETAYWGVTFCNKKKEKEEQPAPPFSLNVAGSLEA